MDGRVRGSLLAMLSAEDSALVLGSGVRRAFGVDDLLVREGDSSDCVHIVVEGWVRMSTVSADGNEVLLALRGPGDVVGESAVLVDGTRGATVHAIGRVAVVQVPDRVFLDLVATRPGIGLALARGMALRLREADEVRVHMATLDVTRRIARYLLRLSQVHGVQSEDGLGIDLPLTQQDVANHLGASLRQVSRSLAVLRERGAVITGRKRLTVAEPGLVAALAGGVPPTSPL
ncbi:Crp/Fnr family transcriptional regulator [Lentzea californiensis]|uniref:Crp/Fnr family transcriptional regulator n=1 Tax=Lentzea californiensis TaxID=438851 RepID=UPI00216630B9|nr:Crp/Fnr family transcriptional regulator [Lentzea californiensis]MCR3752516.1 cAMP-binding domain of CRP or a regulatory subunit of cAMP-dependent protein kinases [Lentzea californiensis]